MNPPASVLALDVGDKRIGVSVAAVGSQFPRPLMTLAHDETIFQQIQRLIDENSVKEVIVGLPRDMKGNETDQTRSVRAFASKLTAELGVTVHLQDEAATSLKAEAELRARGKPYEKYAIDALAATYILEDYLQGVKHGL